MCGAPKLQPLPPPAPAKPPPKKTDPAVKEARKQQQKKAAQSAGQGSTFLTGAQGVLNPATTTKTVLGN